MYGAIDVISDVTDMVLFEWKAYRGCSSHLPVMLYDGVQSLDYDPHSMAYFRPSIQCLMHILDKKGFSHHYIVDDPSQGRVIMISSVKDHALFQGRSVMSKISKFGLLYKVFPSFCWEYKRYIHGKDTSLKVARYYRYVEKINRFAQHLGVESSLFDRTYDSACKAFQVY